MSLSVSVNGGVPVPATSVVLYNNSNPLAVAKQHGAIVIYADAERDPQDLVDILTSLGVHAVPVQKSNLVIAGTV